LVERLKRVREAIASIESPLLEDDVRRVPECSIILDEDANVRVTNLRKNLVKSGKTDPLREIKETKEQISRLEQEATGKIAWGLGMTFTPPPTVSIDASKIQQFQEFSRPPPPHYPSRET
jgi:hypothetical protein